MITRCKWCQDDGVNQKYHDEEWGIPVHDDRKHFEFLMMEVMQCGLNWTMMLNKREIFRQCFDNFDYEKIIHYDEKKIQEIMETPGMIRSPRKIQAVITNARAYLEIIREYGSFDKFLWSYTDGKTLVYKSHQQCQAASNDISDAVSKELKKRGFKYLGSITVYSHLQACGMINDHEESCFLYRQLCDGNSVEYRD
ncbi:MAG: DNA-3-methyladenine glycosylase I [Hungatella hathewayi]|nr:DNA-3-methyladenine glycosylase I [Hungatella hathewayi]